MNTTTLIETLEQKHIKISVLNADKLSIDAPKGALTPALADAIRAHKPALLVVLADKSTEQDTPAPDTERQDGSTSVTSYRPTPDELSKWNRYYDDCTWYKGKNTWNDSPFALALDYALSGHSGSCVAWTSGALIRYYEQCQDVPLNTGTDAKPTSPRQFTELVRLSFKNRNIERLQALASNFHGAARVTEIIGEYEKFTASYAQPRQEDEQVEETPDSRASGRQDEQVRARASTEQHTQTASLPNITKGKGRAIVYADIEQGRAITDAGAAITFPAGCTLSQVLQAIHAAHECDRLYICGSLPDEYTAWLTDAGIWEEYTTGKRGHHLDKEDDTGHVFRYARRVSGDEVEVRTIHTWLGDTGYTIEQARAAMHLLNQYLQGTFTGQVKAYATPALTFQSLWQLENRMHGKKFPVLSDEIRALIHGSTGQGRIELCTPDSTEKIPGLFYYDGIFFYAALTREMPTDLVTHDTKNEYAGYAPARYRIRYTVPMGWQHIGLFMTSREQVTGNSRDNTAWCYPGEKEQGRTFETWADGSELHVAYNLPEGMPAWDITILERIVFKSDTSNKPLDSITGKLVKMREKVEQDARADTGRAALYKLVRGAIRNILLHGIGSFHRKNRDATYILRQDAPAPDGYTGRREIDDNTVWYTVPQKTEAYTQQFEHPEWTALIWARARARITKAALSLPRESLIAIRTDAIDITTEQTQWNDNTKVGTLRQKWHIARALPAPHTFEELDALVHKYIKEDK